MCDALTRACKQDNLIVIAPKNEKVDKKQTNVQPDRLFAPPVSAALPDPAVVTVLKSNVRGHRSHVLTISP